MTRSTPVDTAGREIPASAWSGTSLDPDSAKRPVVRELSTKLAWAIGSTMHVTYGEKTKIKRWADDTALAMYRSYHKRG